MKTLTIKIDTSNAAFFPVAVPEIVRILRELAARYEEQGINASVQLKDINGNTVGSAKA